MADIHIDIHHLPEVQPDDQASALSQSDDRYLQMRDALGQLETALDGYDDLLALVHQVTANVSAQRGDLVDATILLGAFSEGMRTLKQQRDEMVNKHTTLLGAMDHWYSTDNEQIQALVEDVKSMIEEQWAGDGLDYAFELTTNNVAELLSELSGMPFIAVKELADIMTSGDVPSPEDMITIFSAIIENAKADIEE